MELTLYQKLYKKSLDHTEQLTPIEKCILYHGVYSGGEEDAIEALDYIAALTTRLQEAEAVINILSGLVTNHESGHMKEFVNAEARAAAWLKGGTE